MEKRTMVALLLTVVILFFMQQYFNPAPPQEKKEPQKVEQGKEAAPVKTEKGGAIEAKKVETPSPSVKKPSKSVVVETPLLTVKVVDLGGGISSVELKKYKETVKSDKPKELVEDIKPYSYLPRIVKTTNGTTTDDSTYFTPDRDAVTVRDKPETLVMSGALTNGRKAKKIYTFYPDTYTVDVKIETEQVDQEKTLVDFAMISDKNLSSYTFKGPFTYNGKSFEQVEKLDKTISMEKTYKFAGLDEGYFAFIWIPAGEATASLSIMKGENNIPLMRLGLDQGSVSGKMYFGPKKTDVLKSLNVDAQKIVDFGWFDIIAKPMIAGLNWANKVTRNYGIDIILLTILIKIIFYPLSVKSYKSMKEMQKLQPMIQKLKEKYKDDKQKLNAEMMDIYKKKGVNPMGGCLPMVIQIPVFFALYKALSGAIELRHAPFMLWMNDLSAPEDLFSFHVMGYELPIRILPLVMGITQVIQQKMTPTSVDPMQEKMMLFMPIFFTFLFWGFPAGLVLYWLVNNVISIAQQYYINKKVS
jgi:YidC/Oxa1 family membrane protein insertase